MSGDNLSDVVRTIAHVVEDPKDSHLLDRAADRIDHLEACFRKFLHDPPPWDQRNGSAGARGWYSCVKFVQGAALAALHPDDVDEIADALDTGVITCPTCGDRSLFEDADIVACGDCHTPLCQTCGPGHDCPARQGAT